ncbi:hypothetical protein KAFR_0A05820 [Kazachstania africana CBS 2517]|uniref:Uncharacterized protein n=1 Tax=Kazachstania africana (strain ATCC 22294 / BCRC 22015 / CBS 2517 / CECT 1963 / NBRC 1671 / NRRL Y-8276) TaxID=1071382 RepID=H2ANR7_KAZAF|nr:hypothetical protein KAFR_0A05820 [Kazachstania africana CBS 2517]CCF56017.1 hypothetical protein KAFR_0A05820 [Kazachstania africana CBS 2517]
MNNKNTSLKSMFHYPFHRWKVFLKKIAHETLNSLEENGSSSSDEKIDSLFAEQKSIWNKASSTERDSKASMSFSIKRFNTRQGGGNLEMKLSDEPTEEFTTSSNVQNADDTSDEDEEAAEEDRNSFNNVTFDNYDSVKECGKLRKLVGEPFHQGEMIWNQRRTLWSQDLTKLTPEQLRERREKFSSVPKDCYTRIYKKLVVDDKPLRDPVNLQDAIKIINAGWIETQKWENAAKGLA